MRDLPDASGLLAIALKSYEEDVLPVVGPEKRYQALMIANALAIAGREIEDSDRQARASLEALQGILDEKGRADADGKELHARIESLERRLCDEIARGRFDGKRTALVDCLKAILRARLAISNPKILAAKS